MDLLLVLDDDDGSRIELTRTFVRAAWANPAVADLTRGAAVAVLIRRPRVGTP